jgi:DNA polymerase III subunit beta
MKLIVLSSKLKEGLTTIERAVRDGGSLPVLKNVFLRTEKNKIQISATDLELGITRFVFGKIIEEGVVSVPFQTIYKIITNSDSERINLESEKNNLLVQTDNYKAAIQGVNPEEFPIIPKIKNEKNHLEINTSILKGALIKIIPAAQASEIRPEIAGVLFDHQLTVTKLVATDTFRLTEKTLSSKQFKGNFNQGFKIIIPIKTIQEIIRIFPDDETVRIFADDNQVLFQAENIELISRIIDGNYPDYEAIIPKNIDSEAQIGRVQFINALKLVSSFSGKISEVKIRLLENKKTLEVYSANQDLGENRYLIPIKLKGKPFKEVSFNWRYLLDGLKTLEAENIIFGINGDAKPSILKSSEDQSHFYIVMPIKA